MSEADFFGQRSILVDVGINAAVEPKIHRDTSFAVRLPTRSLPSFANRRKARLGGMVECDARELFELNALGDAGDYGNQLGRLYRFRHVHLESRRQNAQS